MYTHTHLGYHINERRCITSKRFTVDPDVIGVLTAVRAATAGLIVDNLYELIRAFDAKDAEADLNLCRKFDLLCC